MPQDLLKCFKVLKKCRNKFDCLVYEMLFIRALKPNLNVQSHSIRAKVFSFYNFLLFIIFAPSYVNFRAKIAFNAVICIYISLIMELWLLRNVGFYRSFLQFYLPYSIQFYSITVQFTTAKIQINYDQCWFGSWFAAKNKVHWFKHVPFLSLASRNFVAVANIAIFLLEVVNFNTTLLCTSRVPYIGHSLAYFVPHEFLVMHGVQLTLHRLFTP